MTQRLRRYSGAVAATGLVVALSAFAPGVVAQASAQDFNPDPGTYTVNTTDMTLTGPFTNFTGEDQGGVAVFSFDNVNIADGVVLVARGSRPVRIDVSGDFVLAGKIDGAGTDSVNFTSQAFDGGPGGGKGGVDLTQPGQGPGGGKSPSSGNNGAGGGGFGGTGARGGVSAGDPGTGGLGGSAYGDINVKLQGGSGGGGASASSPVGGGGGGGGVALHAGNSLTIAATGIIDVTGGSGAVGGFGASGGGSGGAIVLRGQTVSVGGKLLATGGDGGAGGCCGDGGAGGGGRISFQHRGLSLLDGSQVNVAGGESGIGGGGFGHGGVSPDPFGANGVVTDVPAPVATTDAATDISQTTAKLRATVDPNGNSTTYYFEYGTTTAYGGRIPSAVGASAGSSSSPQAVSQDVIGLVASTTYHYRVVATNALGFVTEGADATFATAAVPPPPPPVTDADKDGVPVPQDCNDTNPGIHPGAVDVPGNGVDEDCAGGDATKRLITGVTNSWAAFKKYTTVIELAATGVPAGGTVKITCGAKASASRARISKAGGGCPFKSKIIRSATGGKVNLVKLFNRKKKGSKKKKIAKLQVKTKVEIKITGPNAIGSFSIFTIRAGKIPSRVNGCLAANTGLKTACPTR